MAEEKKALPTFPKNYDIIQEGWERKFTGWQNLLDQGTIIEKEVLDLAFQELASDGTPGVEHAPAYLHGLIDVLLERGYHPEQIQNIVKQQSGGFLEIKVEPAPAPEQQSTVTILYPATMEELEAEIQQRFGHQSAQDNIEFTNL